MTTQEYNVLNQIAYSDFGFNGTDTSGTLQQICQRAVKSGKDVNPAIIAVARGDYTGLSGLTYAGGQNSNDASGFVGYAFRDGEKTICAFRGSEEGFDLFFSKRDWSDNLRAAVTGASSQYPEAVEFARRMSGDGPLEVTGHSKGGNIAIYVASQLDNCQGGNAFNGTGIPDGYLSEAEIQRLKKSGVINYVAEADWVGSTDKHYEKRVFVKSEKGKGSHALDSMIFVDGEPIVGSQSWYTKWLWNFGTEIASTLSYAGHQTLVSLMAKNEIFVSPDEIMTAIGRFKAAQDRLRDAIERLERARMRLDDIWSGAAKIALAAEWTRQRLNINEADYRMNDAIEELRTVYAMFVSQEKNIAASASALNVGESPF